MASGWNLWVWLVCVAVRKNGRHQKKVPRSILTTGARLKKNGRRMRNERQRNGR